MGIVPIRTWANISLDFWKTKRFISIYYMPKFDSVIYQNKKKLWNVFFKQKKKRKSLVVLNLFRTCACVCVEKYDWFFFFTENSKSNRKNKRSMKTLS